MHQIHMSEQSKQAKWPWVRACPFIWARGGQGQSPFSLHVNQYLSKMRFAAQSNMAASA